jgi:hypothetical protein
MMVEAIAGLVVILFIASLLGLAALLVWGILQVNLWFVRRARQEWDRSGNRGMGQ